MGIRSAVQPLLARTRGPIARALLTTGAIAVFCKAIGFGRELVVAAEYGASDALDAFLIAIAIPNLLFNAVGAAIGSALLPRLLAIRREQGDEAELLAQRRAMFWAMALMTVGAIGCAMAGPWLLRVLSPGFSPALREVTQQLLWALIPYTVLCGTSQVWGTLINSEGRFALTAASPGILSGVSVVVLLAAGGATSAWPLLWGLTLGAAIEFTLTARLLQRTRYRARPLASRVTSFERELFQNVWPLSMGALLHTGTLIVDQSMASLLGPGTISELNYGNRLVATVIALVGLTFSRVAFPTFSRLAAAEQFGDLSRAMRRFGTLTLALSLPATVLLCGFSAPIVEWTFRRGQFTAETAASVAAIQACFALQIPVFLSATVAQRAAMALEMNRTVLAIGAGTMAGNAALNLLLIGPLGAPGLALATSIMYAGAMIAFHTAVRRRLRFLQARTAAPVVETAWRRAA